MAAFTAISFHVRTTSSARAAVGVSNMQHVHTMINRRIDVSLGDSGRQVARLFAGNDAIRSFPTAAIVGHHVFDTSPSAVAMPGSVVAHSDISECALHPRSNVRGGKSGHTG
jgi:hypothetical protein